jgi:uncharacterized protein YjbK
MLEVETKFELDASEFEQLKRSAHVAKCIDQVNVYYDRAWKLAELTATFRVRFSRGKPPVLTLKLPVSVAGDTRTMQEFEYCLAHRPCVRSVAQYPEIDVDRELPPDLGDVLLRLGVNRLQRLGWVRNRRYVLDVGGPGKIELDELRLPDGQTVYEAEIDTDDRTAQERLANWVRSAVPEARPSLVSKFQRFRAAVTAQGQRHD